MSRALLVFALATLVAAPAAYAQAPAPAAPASASVSAFLNVTPKRLTFDRTRRTGTIFLLNQGTDAITVDISLVDRVMLPDGQIFAVSDAAARPDGKAASDQLKSARDLLQVSPRRVSLQPGRPQTVRVRLSGLPDASDGEHRTHLTITTLPPRDTGATAESVAATGGTGELRFQVTAVYGLSIPLIVRSGDTDVRAAIAGAHLEYADISADGRSAPKRTAVVALDLVRAGASSVYGNFEVRPAGQARGGEPLGAARGVGVYPEIAQRSVRIPLTRTPAAGETLEVTFTDDDTSPGKVLAKATL